MWPTDLVFMFVPWIPMVVLAPSRAWGTMFWSCRKRLSGSYLCSIAARRLSGHPYSNALISYWNAIVRLGMFGTVAAAVARLCTVQSHQMHLIQQLQDARAQVRVLSDLLPICAWCKKIRDDQGYWEQVHTYIQRHTGTRFTHGMCPDCARDARRGLEEQETT